MIKDPKISFCIPTYNRGNKVFELVKNILQYEENDIEVLVLDNFSTDNTIELLTKIDDSRFRLVRNEKNLGGIQNPYKALSIGNGSFCFLCLDKDFINHQFIYELIQRLEKEKDIVFGHCILNSKKETTDVVFEKGFQSIYNMSYLSGHPSGMFYKKDFFVKTKALNEVFKTNEIFGFQFELINAEMALSGKSLLINLPIFSTETKDECAKTTSFTYKNEEDVFFSPKKQLKTFQIYCNHLYNLELSSGEKKLIIKKILKQFLLSSTIGYKQIMKDNFICQHYHLKPKNISIVKLISIYINFFISFLRSDFDRSILNKLSLFLSVNFNMIFSLVQNKIATNNGK